MISKPVVDFKSKSGLFQKGYKNTLNFTLDIPSNEFLCNLLSKLFESLKIEELKDLNLSKDGQVLANIRGRQFPNSTSEEEFISISGLYLKEPNNRETEEEQDEDEPTRVDFKLSTSFHLAAGKGGIQYKTSGLHTTLPDSPHLRDIQDLFKLERIEWDKFNFGVEFFKANCFGSMIGSAPTLFKRLYIDYNSAKLKLFVEESELETKKSLPLNDEKLLFSLEKILEEAGSTSLLSIIESKT